MDKSILIVEDQFIEAHNLATILERAGYHVLPIAQSVHSALDIISAQRPDLVLLDIFLKGVLTGIDLAKTLREKSIAFVYLSANSNKETLDAAKDTHPYGFLVKPFREKDVLVTLDVAHYLHEHRVNANEGLISERFDPALLQRSIIGQSAPLLKVISQVAIAAPSDVSVLIQGESGTGKELVSSAIHSLSNRADKPYIRVNCAALPLDLFESELFGHEKGAFTGAFERKIGKFERANNGTIFLDEIGEIPIDMQSKLLNVLQEKEIERIGGSDVIKVNVRVIAATNRNLEHEVSMGRFRMDLFYRLNVFPIHVPSLRERKGDIPLLADHFLVESSRKFNREIVKASKTVYNQLEQYDWPGNIRELQNVIERNVLVNASGVLKSVDLENSNKPEAVVSPPDAVYITDSQYLVEILRKCGGKIAGKGGAADFLGLNVTTLHARLKKLGISKTKIFSS